LYKTGDLGRWLPDGRIEFLGRNDNQVKMRGHRIELGEIESALQQYEGISSCTVLVKVLHTGESELVVYFTSAMDQTYTLRAYLKESLPDYMLPSYYVQLDELPLTPNGKVDKIALLNRSIEGLESGAEYVAPRNVIEGKLVKIWEKVLDKERVGVCDDFFTLGGHSIKAVHLVSEYQRVFDVKVSLKDMFINPILNSHVSLIERVEENNNVSSKSISKLVNLGKKIGETKIIKIFAIPFGGGSEYSYRKFKEFCPDELEFVPIELPGRGKRIDEKRLESLYELRDDIFNTIKDLLDEPYVIYGHSMGAILTALLAEKIELSNMPLPLSIFVSGSSGPVTRKRLIKRHLLSDDKFIKMLSMVGGCPKEMLEDDKLLNLFLPILKSDFKAVETYIYNGIKKLNVPIHVMIGTEEKLTLDVSNTWQEITDCKVNVYQFSGDHFFIYEHIEAILTLIKNKILLTTV